MTDTMTRYRHTPDMGEISGFNGDYEECCQRMLEAGMKWLNEHGNADLRAKGLKDVYGLLMPDTPETEELSEAITGAVEDCTGAMHHAVMSRLMFIAKNGWDKYCEELRKS